MHSITVPRASLSFNMPDDFHPISIHLQLQSYFIMFSSSQLSISATNSPRLCIESIAFDLEYCNFAIWEPFIWYFHLPAEWSIRKLTKNRFGFVVAHMPASSHVSFEFQIYLFIWLSLSAHSLSQCVSHLAISYAMLWEHYEGLAPDESNSATAQDKNRHPLTTSQNRMQNTEETCCALASANRRVCVCVCWHG